MKKGILIAWTLFLILPGCTHPQDREPVQLLMSPPFDDSNVDRFWQTIDVSETDLSEKALQEHIRLCRRTGADSQIVVYRGKIVSEWYSDDYQEPVGAMSSTKVVASILVGQLVDMGKLSYDSRVSDILPDWTGGYREEVTIQHLLTHSAGLTLRDGQESIGYAGNKREFVLALFPSDRPGTRFIYSNEGIQLLEPVINALANEKTEDWAKAMLFEPLGMKNTSLYTYGDSAWLYAEMRTTPRDMARIGLLMKSGGIWNGRQVISQDYISRATTPSATYSEMGYAWWILDPTKTVKGFYASGYLNTNIYVFQDDDLVIVRTQAPQGAYSGRNESGDYFEKAMPLFKRMVRAE